MWIWLGMALCVVALAYAGVSFFWAKRYVSPPRRQVEPPEGFESTSWQSEDLHAHIPLWRPAKNPRLDRPVYLFAHGWSDSREYWIEAMTALDALDRDSVAIALPGHDTHAGALSTFGVIESDEIAMVARSLKRQGYRTVVGVGISLGAASTWMAAGKAPEAFDAIVSESGFATMDDALDTWFGGKTGRWLAQPMVWMAERLARARSADVRPIDAARGWNGRPALVIHGDFDRAIPETHALALQKASGADLWRIATAGHAGCFCQEPVAYVERLLAIGDSAHALHSERAVSPR